MARRRSRAATAWTLVTLGAIVLLFNAVILPGAAARIGGPSGAKPLDLRVAYSPTQAYTALISYGEAGRRAYTIVELTADVVYPIAYAFFFSILLTVLVERAWGDSPTMVRLARLPFAVLATDLTENVFVLLLLASFPRRVDALAIGASAFSTIKWTLYAAMLLLVAVGLARALFVRRR